MRRFIYLLFIIIAAPSWASTTLEDADNAYMQGHYEKAAEMYEELSLEGVNADLYYNLGNTYYRLEDLGMSILNYERALALSPDNEDILYNLELAKAKTTDQFNKPSEMFFITWLRNLVQSKSADQWGTISIILLVIGLILFGIYRFNSNISIKKIGFFISMFCLVGIVLTNIAAAWNYTTYQNDPRAVIIKTTQLFKTSNGKEEALRELHPGTIIEITDENSRGWLEIEMPNGKKGWIQQTDAIRIKNSK